MAMIRNRPELRRQRRADHLAKNRHGSTGKVDWLGRQIHAFFTARQTSKGPTAGSFLKMTEDGLRAPRDKTARAAVDFAVRYGMRGRGTLVAFSGGCDSTALLWITARLSGGYFGPVAAMHVNHGIRGDEAERDEKHCRDFCAEHGIPFYSERVDIPAIAKRCGGGIEETARAERYRLLAARAAALGYDRVATAHHADDNLET